MKTRLSEANEIIASINIAPLVDVALVLVIIFMITMPMMMEKMLRVKTSGDQVQEIGSAAGPVLVELKSNGIFVDEKRLSMDQVGAAVSGLMKDRGAGAAVVWAQNNIPHGEVVALLDRLASSGIENLKLLEGSKEN